MSFKHSSAPPNFAVWSTNKTAGRGVVSGQLSVGSGEKGRSAELSVFSFQLSAGVASDRNRGAMLRGVFSFQWAEASGARQKIKSDSYSVKRYSYSIPCV
jgi:hypothetical protein